MVRLVFRPYTHVRRTICTSVSLRSSTRISPGFNLHKHSSPSFGSQRYYSCWVLHIRSNAACDTVLKNFSHFRFLCVEKFLNWQTYTCIGLLGPCFKTGEIKPSVRRSSLYNHDLLTTNTCSDDRALQWNHHKCTLGRTCSCEYSVLLKVLQNESANHSWKANLSIPWCTAIFSAKQWLWISITVSSKHNRELK